MTIRQIQHRSGLSASGCSSGGSEKWSSLSSNTCRKVRGRDTRSRGWTRATCEFAKGSVATALARSADAVSALDRAPLGRTGLHVRCDLGREDRAHSCTGRASEPARRVRGVSPFIETFAEVLAHLAIRTSPPPKRDVGGAQLTLPGGAAARSSEETCGANEKEA